MRGPDAMQESLFTVAKLDDFVPADHPLRSIRVLVNDALTAMNARFNAIYADSGRDSIAPEKLIRALLLQVFYSIRSERQLCEQLRYNLLFRWFVGLALDDPIWDHSTFSKNRDRLLAHQVVEGLFAEVMRLADARGLLSKEHFSVDGTLIQAWASQKSFRPKDGSDDQRPGGGGRNAQADWKGQPRSNDTHASTTDPDARTYRKSHNTASILCYQGHVLMENRNGLVVSAVVTHADGIGERRAALAMLDAVPDTGRRSVGADKAYDTADFVAACRERKVTPHVACERHPPWRQRDRRSHHAAPRLPTEPDHPQAHRGAFRLGQDRRPHSPNGVSRIAARRSAVQAHHDRQQPGAHRSNAVGGALRSDAMNQHPKGERPFRRSRCLIEIRRRTVDLLPASFADAITFIFRPNFNSLLEALTPFSAEVLRL